ncbi:MAG: hypothetical protein Q9227_005102 [Pyrenula ochraceoflavens]
MPLPAVVDIIARDYGFTATVRQWKTAIHEWGWSKYTNYEQDSHNIDFEAEIKSVGLTNEDIIRDPRAMMRSLGPDLSRRGWSAAEQEKRCRNYRRRLKRTAAKSSETRGKN